MEHRAFLHFLPFTSIHMFVRRFAFARSSLLLTSSIFLTSKLLLFYRNFHLFIDSDTSSSFTIPTWQICARQNPNMTRGHYQVVLIFSRFLCNSQCTSLLNSRPHIEQIQLQTQSFLLSTLWGCLLNHGRVNGDCRCKPIFSPPRKLPILHHPVLKQTARVWCRLAPF